MTTIGSDGDSGKDRAIYVRITGREQNRWYVIEEKSSMNSLLSFANEVIGCESERDVVRRLPLPDSGLSSNNLAVLNSRMYLIGGDSYTYRHFSGDLYTYTNLDVESLGYRYMDLKYLDSNLEIEEWRAGGGKLVDHQFGGGVAVGPDGYVYSVGPTVYRFHPDVGKCEKLPIPPQGGNPMPDGLLHRARLLGITKKKLYVYTEEGGADYANVMLSFDLESGKWDEDDVLDDNFWGDWSPGVVLYDDRYLFSFGIRNPKLKPYSSEEDEELFQIREDDDHHLALLWDSVGVSICDLTWCKFILDVCTTTSEDIPRFYAHSLSRGFCLIDEKTGDLLNCAVGILPIPSRSRQNIGEVAGTATRQDGNGTNVMLSFDLESRKWDKDVLDDNFLGTWSPGAVLFQDRYLFSFGTRSPKRKPKTPEEEEAMIIRRRRVQELDEWVYAEEDELVPGIYVFDLHEGRWLPEPVEGLPTDGKVMPHAFRPLPEAPLYFRGWNPRLFQIRKDEDDHRLALLWDAVGMTDECKLIWCKFMINRCETSTDDNPRFSANSLSPGFCPLDEDTFQIFNSAVGM
ncbi:hypothetical protein ACLB2K_033510 [Fragaria x ananassa]